MVDSEILQNVTNGYRERCKRTNHRPTYKGLALMIGISDTTISNVVHGLFNGHEYTDKPHATRCIDNNDFEVIQGLFANPCE